MGRLKKSMVSFDKFCEMLETAAYNYEAIELVDKLKMYDDLLDSAEDSEIDVNKELKDAGLSDVELKEFDEDVEISEFEKNIVMVGTRMFINIALESKNYKKDGYCAKKKILNCAVQMRSDENMLGFISELIPNEPRFIMVDFGDSEGTVKIDIDELILG